MNHRTRRQALVRLLIAIPLCGALIAGTLATAWLALGRPTVASGATWFQLTKVGDAEFSGAPDEPFFFLALGNDARTDADEGLGDAIHVFGVNPATRQATILNVPRDTQAPAGDKINAYHALQGLPGIVEQLNEMMGITIQYAITTNFPGFRTMVDEIGPVPIVLPEAVHDEEFSGANFEAGGQYMNGEGALGFTRARHPFLRGDIDRTENQALFIISTLAYLRGNVSDASTLGLVAKLFRNVRTDDVSLTEMYRLGRLALSIDPANVRSVTIPVGSGAGSNLTLGPGAAELFRDFADDGILQSH